MEHGDGKNCSTCGQRQPLTEFNRRAQAPDGLQARCRSCARRWYRLNTEAHKKNTRRRRLEYAVEVRREMMAFFNEHPCVDCGEQDVRCLDFDHRGDLLKSANVGYLLSQGNAWARIQVEMAKCEVRCANCHRKITSQRAGDWRARAQDTVQQQLLLDSERRLKAVVGPASAHP